MVDSLTFSVNSTLTIRLILACLVCLHAAEQAPVAVPMATTSWCSMRCSTPRPIGELTFHFRRKSLNLFYDISDGASGLLTWCKAHNNCVTPSREGHVHLRRVSSDQA